jgi:hypothetical protein
MGFEERGISVVPVTVEEVDVVDDATVGVR